MQNKIITILGRKGTGKTTLIKKLILENNKETGGPVFIFDYLQEYDYPYSFIITSFKDFNKALLNFPSYKYFVIRIDKENKELATEIDKIFYAIFNIPIKCLIVLDEIGALCRPTYISPALSKLIRCARHKEINLIMATQRPPDIHKLVTSQADQIYIYQFIEPRDIAYIKLISAEYCPEKLKQYEFYLFDARKHLDFTTKKKKNVD